jgi:hypothetical protein
MTMNTQQLIERLSTDVSRVTHHTLAQRIGFGLAGGCALTLVLVIAGLGIRPDLRLALHGFSFWMKLTYTLAFGVGATYVLVRQARPISGSLGGIWGLAVPVLILAGISLGELAETPFDQWRAMWLGQSWKICPWLVLMLAAPIFVGLLWSFRKLAPTRLRVAGAVAGLTAGAWAATLYGLHCPEAAALFVLSWYTLGMLFAAGIGALLGPRLLRW